jgi:hypothetical protein
MKFKNKRPSTKYYLEISFINESLSKFHSQDMNPPPPPDCNHTKLTLNNHGVFKPT